MSPYLDRCLGVKITASICIQASPHKATKNARLRNHWVLLHGHATTEAAEITARVNLETSTYQAQECRNTEAGSPKAYKMPKTLPMRFSVHQNQGGSSAHHLRTDSCDCSEHFQAAVLRRSAPGPKPRTFEQAPDLRKLRAARRSVSVHARSHVARVTF